jgi:hypothetical protein
MFNPWFGPLMFASASTIALRTMMMVPSAGGFSPWQRREAARMVDEKLEAVRESQAEALEFAMSAWTAPWRFWSLGQDGALRRLAGEATASMVAPFGRRAAGNARRLGARAIQPMLPAVPALAAMQAMQAAGGQPLAKVIPLFAPPPRKPARRRRRV